MASDFIAQVAAPRVVRYLPLGVGPAARDYVRAAVLAGQVRQLQFKTRKAELQKKVDVISNLQKGRSGPVRHFEALSAAIPEKCWIESLGIKDEKVTLSGVALNNHTIANFMTALGQTGRFRDVVLGVAEQTTVSGMKLVKFNLTFQTVN